MAEAFHAANNYLVVRLQLHGDSHDGLPIFYEAADEIKRLQEERKKIIAERDAARRWVCRFDAASRSNAARSCGMSDHFNCPKQIAQERGWDCFKEQP